MTEEQRKNYNAKKEEYRKNMPKYQKLRYLENLRKRYDALTPEKKEELFAKRRAYYEANKEKIKAYQRERYHLTKEKRNN